MLELKVEDYLKKKEIVLNESRILVGVSGGPDSLALLHYLWSKESEWGFVVMAAHVDHMFRGEESLEEAKFVEAFCQERSIPIAWKSINVPEVIKKTGANSQHAARECRYEYYHEIMELHQMNFLALGHHGDDQVESILMRLTRGSTGSARAGIPFQRAFGTGKLFRPFLCLERAEIEEYCKKHKLNPRRDPSNEKETYSRNRFRKHVIPFLKKENTHVSQHFQRFSEEIAMDESFLMEAAKEKLHSVVRKKEQNEVIIDIDELLSIANSLQRRCIHLILTYLYKNKPASLSAIHTDQMFALFKSPHSSGKLDLPEGLSVIKSYRLAHFCINYTSIRPFYYEISKMGEILLPNGYSIKVEYISNTPDLHANNILVNPEAITFPLVVRTRRNGDRIQIKGMQGMKKVKGVFIDKKIPRHERDGWPIIADGNDNILWLPGLKKSIYSLPHMNSGCNLLITYKKH